MTIEYKGFKIEGGKPGESGVLVTVTWRVPDVPEAEQLITGCRTLGLQSQAAKAPVQAAAEEAPKAKPKLAAVPKPAPDTSAAGSTPEADHARLQQVQAANGAAKSKSPGDAQREGFAAGNVAVDRAEGARRTVQDEPKAADGATPPAPAPGKKVKVTEAMRTGKFRAVIEELAKQGFNDKVSLLRVVPKIREHVPALKAVAEDQIPARIEAAVDILGLGA